MLRKIVTTIILVPLVVLLLGFAVANRQIVTVSFDPFDATQPAYAMTLPLFGIVFVLLTIGAIIGGIAAWLRQGRHRRNARALNAEVQNLRAEVQTLRAAQQQPAPPAINHLALPPTS